MSNPKFNRKFNNEYMQERFNNFLIRLHKIVEELKANPNPLLGKVDWNTPNEAHDDKKN